MQNNIFDNKPSNLFDAEFIQNQERQQRIFLRDQERSNRGQNLSQDQYGKDPFGAPSQLKRDQVLAQKLQQRQQMIQPLVPPSYQIPQHQMPQQPLQPLQQFNQMQMHGPEPQYQMPSQQYYDPEPQQKTSMIAQKLQNAKNLDMSLSLDRHDPLIQAGIAQIGDHQYNQQQNKLRQQQEYKRILDENVKHLQKGTPPLAPTTKQPRSFSARGTQSSDQQKKMEAEKKQQYAEILREQIRQNQMQKPSPRQRQLSANQRADFQQPPQPMHQMQERQPEVLNHKEEYRRQLEQQMQEAQFKKQQLKQDRLQYDLKYDKDTAEVIQSNQQQQVRRGQSDITRQQVDNSRLEAKQRYQNELKLQMQQQKEIKQQLKEKQKLEDEREERRLEKERQVLAGRERQDLSREGRTLEDDKPKKMVNRSQFERSDEQGKPPLRKADSFKQDKEPFKPVHQQSQQFENKSRQQQIDPQFEPRQQQFENKFEPPQQFYVQPHPKHPQAHPQYQQQPFQQQPLQSFPQQYQNFAQQIYQPPQTPQTLQPAQDNSRQLFDDQQKMIVLYQQALEQIMKYRNQYFEQAMEMRENILKEREQMFEFEKMKNQQMVEMQQLKDVKLQLQAQSHLTPVQQGNLDLFIGQQKEMLQTMSHSLRVETERVPLQQPSQYQQKVQQQPVQPIHQYQQPSQYQQQVQQQLVQPIHQYQQPSQYQQQVQQQLVQPIQQYPQPVQNQQPVKQQTVQPIEQYQQVLQQPEPKPQYQQPSNHLETSLASNSKLIKVPQQVSKVPQQQSPTGFMTTWNQETHQKSPFRSASVQMEPMRQEMFSPPRQSELNDRESEYENHQTIESNMSRKKATGSSFYDKTLKQQKQQVIVKQNEWNQQMLRIFSTTNNVQIQDEEIDRIQEESNQSEVLDKSGPEKQIVPRARQKWDQKQDLKASDKTIVYEQTQSDWERTNQSEFVVPVVFSKEEHPSMLPQSIPKSTQKFSPLYTKTCTQSEIPEDIQIDAELKQANDMLLGNNPVSKSSKEIEMMEIAALIRKAKQTTDAAIAKGNQKVSPYTAKPIIEESESASPMHEHSGNAILADLDRIINNLEQQKNLATFGNKEEQEEVQEKQQWKTLKEARSERPKTAKSVIEDNYSDNRSYTSKSPQRAGQYTHMAVDQKIPKSPQKVGKFTQMVINKKPSETNLSKSPQRVGKFAQMAMDQSPVQSKMAASVISNQQPSERPVSGSILRPLSGSRSSRYS